MPLSRAYLMKSQTMRKYPEYFICLMMPISKFRRDSYSWVGERRTPRNSSCRTAVSSRFFKPSRQTSSK